MKKEFYTVALLHVATIRSHTVVFFIHLMLCLHRIGEQYSLRTRKTFNYIYIK